MKRYTSFFLFIFLFSRLQIMQGAEQQSLATKSQKNMMTRFYHKALEEKKDTIAAYFEEKLDGLCQNTFSNDDKVLETGIIIQAAIDHRSDVITFVRSNRNS